MNFVRVLVNLLRQKPNLHLKLYIYVIIHAIITKYELVCKKKIIHI